MDARRLLHSRLALLRVLLLLGVVVVLGAARAATSSTSSALAVTTFEQRVGASADDAEERATGGMYLNSSDLELVYDGSNQRVGIRWTAVTIPKGATISRAYVQFEAKETQSEATNLLIEGIAADNPTTFTSASGNVSTRPRTSASAGWQPVPWTLIGEAGVNERTPDLSALIQEIVNRPGWASGNALALVITGTGHRTARAWDSKPAGAPLLHVEYTTGPPPPNTPPNVSAGADLTVTLPNSASLDGTVTDDGLPNPPGTTTTTWTVDSGPGPVTFQNANATDTQASFTLAGTYTLRLTANDSDLTNSATTQITVLDGPPQAKLAVTPVVGTGPVTADASSSTDTDGTPIATYSFDFGDGSPVVGPQPDPTATHTFATDGSYTVVVTVTDTAGLSSTATKKVTIGQETPPNAKLTVSPSSGTAPLAVSADASASTDPDATPIATYTFDFGDGTAKVGPQASAVASHTYSATGTFTATVTVTDSAGVTGTASSSVSVAFPTGPMISVSAGYYDTHHGSFPQPKPSPWKGSAGVVFVGTPDSSSGGWDTSGVMITDRGTTALSGVLVTVDIGSKHFGLWNAQTIPAGQNLILAQTGYENFDGSDTSPAGCYGCDPKLCITDVVKTVPVVHVSIGAYSANYQDPKQILNTQGADKAGCPDTGGTRNDESEAWQALG